MAKDKSKKKDRRSRKQRAAAPKLLARPTIRSLTVAAQPVCLTVPEPSTEALSATSGYGSPCSGCFGVKGRGDDAAQTEQFVQLDLRRFVPELERDVKLRRDADEPLLFHKKTERTYVLNSGALAMLELIDGARSAEKIAKRLLKKYCVSEEALLADLEALLKTLAAMGLLRTQ